MPAQTQRQSTTQATATPVVETTTPTQVGDNAFNAEQLKLQSAKQTYEQALGSFLGGELFKVVNKELSRDKLEKLAQGAVDDAFGSVRDWLVSQAEPSEQAIARQFGDALKQALEPRVNELIADTGVTDAISDYAMGSPYSMLAAALAGVATYILTNQDIPTVEHKMGLGGGHAILAGLDLGSTLDIAVREVTAGYRYQGGNTTAALNGAYTVDDGSYSVDGNIRHTADSGIYGLEGSYSRSDERTAAALAATYQNDSLSARLFGQSVTEDDKTLNSLGAELRGKYGDGGNASYYATGQYNSDDTWRATAGTSFGNENDGGSWNIEAFGEERAGGRDNWGAQLRYKLRF